MNNVCATQAKKIHQVADRQVPGGVAYNWSKYNMKVTNDQLKDALSYDAESGAFVWKIAIGRKIRPGRAAGANKDGYTTINLCGERFLAHRLAWMFVNGSFPDGLIDHIDGNKSNNAIANLRIATASENGQNRKLPNKNNKCGLIGARFVESKNKFVASIRIDGKSKHIGYFKSAELAHSAYISSKKEVHPFATFGEAA